MRHLAKPAAVSVLLSLLSYGLLTAGLLFYALGAGRRIAIPGVFTIDVARDGAFSAAFGIGYLMGFVVLFVLFTVLLAVLWRTAPPARGAAGGTRS